MRKKLNCFRKYDIRGRLGIDLDADISFRIGRAVSQYFSARKIILGFDARETSPELANEVARGICESGTNVLNIGLSGTEEMYWAVTEFKADAGIQITASHNPIEYNGMKLVKIGSSPLSEKEFSAIKVLTESNNFLPSQRVGVILDIQNQARKTYIKKLVSFVDFKNLKPIRIVINSGNGAAGPTIDALERLLSEKGVETNFFRLHHSPDSSFPNGIPNPLLEENRFSTAEEVKSQKADFGVAFDGDFDRCFFFDHQGNFISSEYMVGLLAEIFLRREPGSTIIHEPRLVYSTSQTVKELGGQTVVSKTGHAFMKSAMRFSNGIYGGEISAHHYFRDFAFCDSGIIPWLLIWEHVSKEQKQLADFITEKKQQFPSSGEMNFEVSNAEDCIEMFKDIFASTAILVDEIDGLSVALKTWRFNLRKSNTEPLVRLNIETLGDLKLLREKTEELKHIILGM